MWYPCGHTSFGQGYKNLQIPGKTPWVTFPRSPQSLGLILQDLLIRVNWSSPATGERCLDSRKSSSVYAAIYTHPQSHHTGRIWCAQSNDRSQVLRSGQHEHCWNTNFHLYQGRGNCPLFILLFHLYASSSLTRVQVSWRQVQFLFNYVSPHTKNLHIRDILQMPLNLSL